MTYLFIRIFVSPSLECKGSENRNLFHSLLLTPAPGAERALTYGLREGPWERHPLPNAHTSLHGYKAPDLTGS